MRWANIHKSKVNNFHRKRTNAHCYYSAGVDRFFAVDSLDPYTAYEVAQILSSKMPSITICLLDKDEPTFDNSECHNYTISKEVASQFATINDRQVPLLRILPAGSVVDVGGLPLDYQSPDSKQTFLDFKQYALFVIRAWHAARICNALFNFTPIGSYINDFFPELRDKMFAPSDQIHGHNELGVTEEIKRILYFSNNHQEALEKISQLWQNNNTPPSLHWRAFFYKLLDEEIPAELDIPVDLDNYSGWLS